MIPKESPAQSVNELSPYRITTIAIDGVDADVINCLAAITDDIHYGWHAHRSTALIILFRLIDSRRRFGYRLQIVLTVCWASKIVSVTSLIVMISAIWQPFSATRVVTRVHWSSKGIHSWLGPNTGQTTRHTTTRSSTA